MLRLPERAHPPLKAAVEELLQDSIPDVQKDLDDLQRNLQTLPVPQTPTAPNPTALTYSDKVKVAVTGGEQKYTKLNCPILAIFAGPTQTTVNQAHALETAIPSAHVVRLPNAGHYVYPTNVAKVKREMNAFMDGLPKVPTSN